MNGLYQVSNLGRVKSLGNSKTRKEKILKPEIRTGYYSVNLCKSGKRKKHRVHRLVAQAFIENPKNLPVINHIDENKLNNCVENLEWCTHEYNMNCYAENHPEAIICSQQSVYCFDLDQYFKSASEAAVHTGVCRTSIVKACRGQLNSAGGKLWCYSKDKDKIFP